MGENVGHIAELYRKLPLIKNCLFSNFLRKRCNCPSPYNFRFEFRSVTNDIFTESSPSKIVLLHPSSRRKQQYIFYLCNLFKMPCNADLE